MSTSIRFTTIALAAVLAGSVVACESTEQPDIGEAFADITSGEESTGEGTTTETEATEPAPAPKTAEQADEEDLASLKNRRTAAHSNDRASKSPLKGD